ncbi:MAG: hypothetical protein KTR16_08720 [Acidiferrobacterales bacterium]|nr:hypothetical protein [Acidiferrobacterales bacterium]
MSKWLAVLLVTLTCFSLSLASEERGLGGTGKYLDEDRGLGGTGKYAGEDRGLGGTGIIGTITEFGSIWVNGLEIELTNDTQITMDGHIATENELRLGQQTKVLAIHQGNQWIASKIEIEHGLIGRVSQGNTAIKINGVNIKPAPDFPGTWPKLQDNDYVKASGYFIAEQFYATDIAITADNTSWQIIAPVTYSTETGWKIAGENLPDDMMDATEGETVILRGRYTQRGKSLYYIRHERHLPFSGKVNEYLIENRSDSTSQIDRFTPDQWQQKKQSSNSLRYLKQSAYRSNFSDSFGKSSFQRNSSNSYNPIEQSTFSNTRGNAFSQSQRQSSQREPSGRQPSGRRGH